jgi:4'-phosphopantetheinyl transferase EntD
MTSPDGAPLDTPPAIDADVARRLAELFSAPVAVAAVRLTGQVHAMFPEEARSVASAVRKRRIEFSAGRYCARIALSQLGFPPLAIASGADRAPIWPAGAIGSISHDDALCVAVAARCDVLESVGVDIERVDAVDAELAGDILRQDERSADGALLESGVDALTLHFCLKEAAYKAFYPLHRQVIGFHEMRIGLTDHGGFHAEALVSGAPRFVGRYALHEGRILAASWPSPHGSAGFAEV